MNSFSFYNPTRIYFGEGAIENLNGELKKIGQNVLLAYGKGAIKREGIYDSVVKVLAECNKHVTEFSGIMANPTAAKVREGIKLCKENNIDFILAVGGGSTIDCCKAVAAGCKLEGDFWEEIFIKGIVPRDALPLGTILTMSGTASEMNGNSVITNEELKIKDSFASRATYPKFSILDPSYTYSLPQYQMVSGICDVMSHIMEQYFSGSDDNVSDDLSEALMKSVIKNAKIAINYPRDYCARSNIMWGATLALNGLLGCAKAQDWEVHQIEHQLGAYYDVAHGMGLAAVTPTYLRYIYSNAVDKFRQFALNVWHVDPNGKTDEQIALEGIDRLEAFFKEIGATTSLRALGITDKEKLEEIAESCYTLSGGYRTLTHSDINGILNDCF